MPALVQSSGLPVACLEYRLAPNDRHPAQAIDIVSGLSLLTGTLLPLEDGEARWNHRRIYLVGHSAGAFIAATLVLQSPSRPPSFSVPSSVRDSLQGVVCVDGIYDLPELLTEYPSYYSFVSDAFGRAPSFLADESPARWHIVKYPSQQPLRFLILHSKEDELLSLQQPKLFIRHLETIFIASQQEEEDRSESERAAWGSVEVDYDSLKGGHAELLLRKELSAVVASWVRRVEEQR
jgi:acetyl esterase/lipase